MKTYEKQTRTWFRLWKRSGRKMIPLLEHIRTGRYRNHWSETCVWCPCAVWFSHVLKTVTHALKQFLTGTLLVHNRNSLQKSKRTSGPKNVPPLEQVWGFYLHEEHAPGMCSNTGRHLLFIRTWLNPFSWINPIRMSSTCWMMERCLRCCSTEHICSQCFLNIVVNYKNRATGCLTKA